MDTPDRWRSQLAGPAEDGEPEEALEALGDVLMWQLAPARWETVRTAIEAVEVAHAAGDAAALRRATIELELLAPIRITRIGSEPTVAAPERIRERTNQLIHSLEAASSAPRTSRHDDVQRLKDDLRASGPAEFDG